MKKGLILLLVLLALPIALANECDDFCVGSGFEYGNCRETTEAGFCEGNEDEEVFGFSYCEDLERCCCGNSDSAEEEVVAEDTTSSIELPSFSSEQMFFVLLLILTVVLGIMLYNKRKKKDDVFKELQP